MSPMWYTDPSLITEIIRNRDQRGVRQCQGIQACPVQAPRIRLASSFSSFFSSSFVLFLLCPLVPFHHSPTLLCPTDRILPTVLSVFLSSSSSSCSWFLWSSFLLSSSSWLA